MKHANYTCRSVYDKKKQFESFTLFFFCFHREGFLYKPKNSTKYRLDKVLVPLGLEIVALCRNKCSV